MALQVPSLRRPRFLPPSPAPGTSRQLGRGAGTARAVGPVQPPPKHRTQVPHSCAKPRLGPGGLWPRDCWLSRPEGLVPGAVQRSLRESGSRRAGAAPGGTSHPALTQDCGPALPFRTKMDRPAGKPEPDGVRRGAHGSHGPEPRSQSPSRMPEKPGTSDLTPTVRQQRALPVAAGAQAPRSRPWWVRQASSRVTPRRQARGEPLRPPGSAWGDPSPSPGPGHQWAQGTVLDAPGSVPSSVPAGVPLTPH